MQRKGVAMDQSLIIKLMLRNLNIFTYASFLS